jgi:hypothetical protein
MAMAAMGYQRTYGAGFLQHCDRLSEAPSDDLNDAFYAKQTFGQI